MERVKTIKLKGGERKGFRNPLIHSKSLAVDMTLLPDYPALMRRTKSDAGALKRSSRLKRDFLSPNAAEVHQQMMGVVEKPPAKRRVSFGNIPFTQMNSNLYMG